MVLQASWSVWLPGMSTRSLLTRFLARAQMGAMLCYDALVAPVLPPWVDAASPPPPAGSPPPSAPAGLPQQETQQCEAPQQQQPQPPPLPQVECKAGDRSRGQGRADLPAAQAAAAATQLLQQALERAAAAASAAAARDGSNGHYGVTSPKAVSVAATADEQQRQWRQGLGLKLCRMAVVAAAVPLYAATRSWLAGDQVNVGFVSA